MYTQAYLHIKDIFIDLYQFVLDVIEPLVSGTTRDTMLLALVITACMCGSYKNQLSHFPQFKGNIAHVVDRYAQISNKELHGHDVSGDI